MRSIPVLLYHHVSPDREITPEVFEGQLSGLLAKGYRAMALHELLEVTRGLRRPEGPAFCVTFDDGYVDNWHYAFPILERLRVPATIFVVSRRVQVLDRERPCPSNGAWDTRTQERAPEQFLSWAELRAMAASGWVTVGSHTHTHRQFVRQEPYGDLRGELVESKTLIEQHVGQPCDALAWPWGEYRKSWWPMLQELGYRLAVTTDVGANRAGTSPFQIARLNVHRADSGWFAQRIALHSRAAWAEGYGFIYGWDRRFKSVFRSYSPYSGR